MADEHDRELYDDADPDAALRRLESLGRGGAAPGARGRREPSPPTEPVDQAPAAAPREQLPPDARQLPPDARPLPASRRPRPALAPDRSVRLARLLAPVVFLAAVLVVFSLAWRAGVVGDGEGGAPVASPSPKASAKKTPTEEPTAEPDAGSGTKTYTVKAGDTLSGIAERFDTTVTELEDLNADQDLQTLNPGQELTVPSP
ncbi:MAG: LysM peptidoglycan-binding domain-containing protein [Thermoleophilia bacterium]|jgi:nucleoid-associated protein YgaU|nr:LysM peptidoglycan-binding domain-containing protein [Thermoleophilia bacterium]